MRRRAHDALWHAIADARRNCGALKDEGHSRQQHWIELSWLCPEVRATGQRRHRAKIHSLIDSFNAFVGLGGEVERDSPVVFCGGSCGGSCGSE